MEDDREDIWRHRPTEPAHTFSLQRPYRESNGPRRVHTRHSAPEGL